MTSVILRGATHIHRCARGTPAFMPVFAAVEPAADVSIRALATSSRHPVP